MNKYKIRAILGFIQDQGKLPTDQAGVILNEDDLLVWYGLDNVLTSDEKMHVRRELAGLAEAEAFMERIQ